MPVYVALEGVHDDGFRNFSASNIRRFYGDVGAKNDRAEFHLNVGAAENDFGATATVPVELLQQYYGSTYTTPQTSDNRVGYLNLTGKGRGHTDLVGRRYRPYASFRSEDRRTAIRPELSPATADATLLCFGDGSTPANGLNGAQLANPFDPSAVLGEIDRTTTHTTTGGVSLQATNTDQLFGHNNHFVVGASFDSSVTNFTASAELGTIGPNYVVSGSGIFLGQSGNPVSIGPVSLRTTNQYTGLYALDTFDVTKPSRSRRADASMSPTSACKTSFGSRAERQRYLHPLQSDHRRHLQDHFGLDGLCRLFGSQSRADPVGTRLRRSGASLHRRSIPGLRSAAETSRVPHRGSWTARHAAT